MELLIHNKILGAFVFLITRVKNFEMVKNLKNKQWLLKHQPLSHHSLDHLNEFSACQLDSLRVAFNPDQVASL